MTTLSEHIPKGVKGSYILVMYLDEDSRYTIGKFGTFAFPAGWYLYTGSAFGSGGLLSRLSRHLRKEKKIHWHIDHLTTRMPVIEIWYDISGSKKEEQYASALEASREISIPVPRFGCGDSPAAASHLFYSRRKPSFVTMKNLASGKAELHTIHL